MKKNLLILIGNGKSTLTNFLQEDNMNTLYGINELINNIEKIKNNNDLKFVCHLNIKGDSLEEVIAEIKNRTLIYNISF